MYVERPADTLGIIGECDCWPGGEFGTATDGEWDWEYFESHPCRVHAAMRDQEFMWDAAFDDRYPELTPIAEWDDGRYSSDLMMDVYGTLRLSPVA